MWITAWLAAQLASGDPAPVAVDFQKPPVVVVHGIHSSSRDMVRMVQALRADGRETFAIDLRPQDGSASLEQLSEQLAAFITEKVHRRPVDLIGYSMGGLVSRHYLQRRGGLKHVRRFISLSAPHHGTVLGWLNRGSGARQMRLGSAFLEELNADAQVLQQVGMVSLWTRTDLVILPPRSSVLPAVHNEHIWGLGHASWIFQRRFIRRVVALLQEE
jgi:triacylglycerol lipase